MDAIGPSPKRQRTETTQFKQEPRGDDEEEDAHATVRESKPTFKFGFARRKLSRLRALHIFLCGHCFGKDESAMAGASSAENPQFRPMAVLAQLPVRLFLRIVGVERPTDALSAFLDNEANADTPLDQVVPLVLREELYYHAMLRNVYLLNLFDSLVALHLVNIVDETLYGDFIFLFVSHGWR